MVHLHDEVIPEAEKAHNGKEVDKDESQQRSEQDGAPVPCYAFDDVEERLLPVDQVKQLCATPNPELVKQYTVARKSM